MAWETRKGSSGRYYTRSRREGGRVIREYIGCGLVAEAIAALDAQERWLREEQDERLGEQVVEAQAVDQQLNDIGELCDVLAQVVLWQAGYHKHRGEWRKRRA